MIAACPRCSARYRVDRERLGPDGARLRCARCQAVFRVRPPAGSPEAAAQRAEGERSSLPRPRVPHPPAAEASPRRTPERATPPPDVDRERLVVVADPEVEAGKRTASALAGWGLQPILVHDGVEAMLTIQRALPRAVVLDAALPKMYGFQICEVLKRNDSLRGIRVALVGAIHHQGRYRRPPSDLYGADAYVERPDLPDALVDVLRGWGLPLSRPDEPGPGAAPPQPPAAEPEPRPVAAAEPQAALPPAPPPAPERATAGPAADGLHEERIKAERLARIIVSDIALYNPEKFEQGVRDGNVAEVLRGEIDEGRSLFGQRIDQRIRDERDYLVEELVRVARERGMQ